MRRILPVGPPPLFSYLFHFHPLSILAQEEAYLPWLYSSHVQLFYYPGETLKIMVHPLSTSHRVQHAYTSTCPLLEVQSVELTAARQLTDGSLLRAWARLIKAGYYVQPDVDFYHLSHRPEYRMKHLLHEVLLHGVDTGRQEFTALSFGSRGRPVSLRVPFQEMEQAVEPQAPEVFQEDAQQTGQMPPWFTESMAGRPRLFLFRYVAGRACVLDVRSVVEQLSDYLNSYNTSSRHRLDGAAREGGVWGMRIYDWLRDQLAALARNVVSFDPMTWHVLWEHKACMLRRLLYLEANGFLCPPDLAQQYAHIERAARALLWMLLRSAAAGEHDYRPAHTTLGRMATGEARLLECASQRLRAIC